jgi:hypothetical protein
MVASASKAGSRIETSGCVPHPRGMPGPCSLMMFFELLVDDRLLMRSMVRPLHIPLAAEFEQRTLGDSRHRALAAVADPLTD